jgi:hypothetical protein
MSKHESDYMGRVKSLSCVLCDLLGQPQSGVTEAHHIRTGHGLGDRASDFLTVALCVDCHRGTHGFHGTKTLMRIAKLSEMDLLAETIRQLDKKRGRESLPLREIFQVSPTGNVQENAADPEHIREGQTIQPRVPRRRNKAVRSGQTSPA